MRAAAFMDQSFNGRLEDPKPAPAAPKVDTMPVDYWDGEKWAVRWVNIPAKEGKL